MKFTEIASRFTGAVEQGDKLVVICPVHNDHDPSLVISVNEKNMALLKCRAGCDTKEIIERVGLRMADLFDVENDANLSNVQVEKPQVSDVTATAALAAYLHEAAERLKQDDETAAEALAYAERRFGITHDTALALGLGVDDGSLAHPPFISKIWTRVPRLVVPFRDERGVPRGAQARDLTDQDGTKWCSLNNVDGATWAKTAWFNSGTGLDYLIITEGPGDGLTAAAHGVDAVAVRGAALAMAASTEFQKTLRDRRVVVAGDNDKAGNGFADGVAKNLAKAGLQVHRLTVPEPYNDLSEWFEKAPDFRTAFIDAVRSAPVESTRAAAPKSSLDDYELTDLGNAQRLKDHFDGNLRYSPEAGWFIYDGMKWGLDRLDLVRQTAQDVMVDLMKEGERLSEADDSASQEQGKRLYGWAKRCQSKAAIDAMINEAKALRGIPVLLEDMDGHKDLLAFRNGIVNLRTGELGPHNRDLLITRAIEFDFNPDATAERWLTFLDEIMEGDPEMVEFLQRLIGYGITGRTDEQCFAVLWGTGANGKSVFTDTLNFIFRATSQVTPFSTFEKKSGGGGIPNDIAALRGARLVFASEGDQGAPMAESVIKRMTGQDEITARFMRREFFSFSPEFLILLATNHKPSFRGQDEGLWRRVKLIPFNRTFKVEERDHYLSAKLRNEAEGIIAWAVRGAVEWYKNGLREPQTVKDATQMYRENSDLLDGFFPGEFERGTREDKIKASDLFNEYQEWAEDQGLSLKEIWSQKAFYAAMEERGVLRRKYNGYSTFFGIVATRDAAPEAKIEVGKSTRRKRSELDAS